MSDDDSVNRFEYRDLYSGLIRLHILHHAVEGPIFGLEMAQALARYGYQISLGTAYPLLHGLEERGCRRSSERKLSELSGELNESM
jgi:DNA-binding PadR family transcriptional regulator